MGYKNLKLALARGAAVALLLLSAAALIGQTAENQQAPLSPSGGQPNPEQYLRTLYYRGDRALIVRDGEPLANRSGASAQTRAWYFTATAWEHEKSFPVLDLMRTESPDDPWTLAVLSYVTEDLDQSIALCQRAWAKEPSTDIVVICTDGINGQVVNAADAKRLQTFFEENRSRYEGSAETLVAEAEALGHLRFWNGNARNDAVAFFDRALKMSPHNIRALLGKSLLLPFDGENFRTLQAAAPWAKESEEWHSRCYQLINKATDIPPADRARWLEADGRELIARAEPTTGAIVDLVTSLRKTGAPQTAAAMFDLVVQKYPDTQAALMEMELEQKATAKLGDDPEGSRASPELRREVAGDLIAILNQYEPEDGPGARDASSTLTDLARSGSLDDKLLLAAVRATGYQWGTDLALQLARRNAFNPELERLAKARILRMIALAATRASVWHNEKQDFDLRLYCWKLGTWYAVLGSVYLQQGKLDDAAHQLQEAEQLLSVPLFGGKRTFLEQTPEPLTFLGELYTAKGDYDKAQEYLARAISIEYRGDDEHPAIAAYKDLYRREHGGSTDGIDAYMATVSQQEQARRRARVLKDRLSEPESNEPFTLKSVDGKTISSDALKGKIVVINFWGTWCGPCRSEMPELQKFYERYRTSRDVVFLTIDQGDTADDVKKYLSENKLTIPVLLSAGYADKARINMFPTTLFIGPDGKRIFEKMGSSRRVLEEFTWRVEAMQESLAKTDAKPAMHPQ